MPHGHPDWGVSSALSTVYVLEDMAELAARLGSIVSFDRRGNIVWLEDFEHGVSKWRIAYSGTGYGVSVALDAARSGAYSAKLITRNSSPYNQEMYHYLPAPVLGKIGLEAHTAMTPGLSYIEWRLAVYEGSYVHLAHIRYTLATGILSYYNSGGGYTTIATGLGLLEQHDMFHALKVVVDLVNEVYFYVILDSTVYLLTNIAYRKVAAAIAPNAMITLAIAAPDATPRAAYYDDVIVTQNEP